MNLPADASDDQSNCPPDYYRRNNGILHQIPQNNATDTKFIPDLNDNELRKLAREKLSEALQAVDAAKDRDLAVRLSNAVLDRVDGKPSQSMAVTVEDKGLGKLSDERLLRLEASLARMTGQEAIVIPPEPRKLDAT